ncbi:MAG: cytochrome P450 [Chloroflexi bacterium]|nr:cytochrome P450 [Chloroflexota bacterium]MBP7045688.1 cytochrome P450 [Chloroflexota bacterium]
MQPEQPDLTAVAPEYDLFSPKFKANPFPTFATMRAEAPIYAHVARNGSTIWYITRYDDVIEVLKDNERFVKDVAHTLLPEELERKRPSTLSQRLINENMLFADPPDHTRLRALVNQAFTPRRVEENAPRVQAIADSLVDRVVAAKQMDLIADFALPLPTIVITDLLGIPAVDRELVADLSQAIIAPGRHGLTFSARKRKVRAFVAYLQELFAERQRRPQDDLISALVGAEEAGERLNSAELSSMVALLLVTGHETTVNLIGNGVLALLRHPEQVELVKGEVGVETAVEELLRFDGPVETSTTRWVRRDVVYKGCQMRRGDVVRVVLASANRDESQFAQADKLDVCRANNRHLAFGHGIHYCLGAPLARLEGKIALQTLFGRLPNLRTAVPPAQLSWRSGVLFRGLERLPLAWD